MKSLRSIFRSPLLAAAFLMATSAIGPGFLTQTALFTDQLMASFGFVILVSILLDIGAQLNIWRIISASGLRAQDLANRVLPGTGFLLTLMIALGGLAFNIGNLAGAGLGLNVLTGIDVKIGALLSAGLALTIFWVKNALSWIDVLAKLLGMLMLGLTLYVVIGSEPPVGEALYRSIAPEKIDIKAILTLVGGTVGGYISFAGAHRLLDAGWNTAAHIPQVTRSAVTAILLASVMRILLFLAALGVVWKGLELGTDNPAAAVFKLAGGAAGYTLFGAVMWSAAITSVVGSVYTSVSFLKTLHPILLRQERTLTNLFILVSASVFLWVGKPVQTLVFVGALNGFILPFALALILLGAYRKQIVGAYRHPLWLTLAGVVVVAATVWMGVQTLLPLLP